MSGFSPAVRALVYARAGNCCEVCGVYTYGGSIHHRRPRGMGGDKRPETNRASNGLLTCGSGVTGCHGDIEAERGTSLALGLLVRRNDLPAQVPVHLRIGFVLLDDTGNYLPQEEV